MANITVKGRDFAIAPYMLGSMIAAAPFVDAMKARQAEVEVRAGVAFLPGDLPAERAAKTQAVTATMTLVETMANLRDVVEILHIGVAKIDPAITVDDMLEAYAPTGEDMSLLMVAMNEVLRRGGLQSGEAKAPVTTDPTGA